MWDGLDGGTYYGWGKSASDRIRVGDNKSVRFKIRFLQVAENKYCLNVLVFSKGPLKFSCDRIESNKAR